MVAERGVGTVLASFGRGVLVQTADAVLRCGLLGRKLKVVCGDRVAWKYPDAADDPSVESVEVRRNLIERMDARGRPEAVAANIDRLGIVVGTEPLPDWFLVDRYWAGAALKDVEAVLILNKADLGSESLQGQLDEYRRLNLPCVEVSCLDGSGIDALKALLSDSVTMLVGQSGVGKSSLVNALAPEAAAQTAQLTKDQEGRHTTTTARWYPLTADAALIDAPGVRDFAPPASIPRAAERGFIEIRSLIAGCRFKDCRHMEEPGCAVRSAVLKQDISARRYESYRRLFRLYQRLS
jgi:ribosome biogenesis GTPase